MIEARRAPAGPWPLAAKILPAAWEREHASREGVKYKRTTHRKIARVTTARRPQHLSISHAAGGVAQPAGHGTEV
eukprot:scaffold10524_cov113-Isochrysis_galbana.AAC.5